MDLKTPFAAVIMAVALNTINTYAGYLVAKKAFGKELNTFLALVFGSFGVRAIVVIGFAWYALAVISVEQVWFSITFAITCFVALMGEILFFHRSFEAAKRRIRRPVTDLLKKKSGETTYANSLKYS